MFGVDEPYGPISWFLGTVWIAVFAVIITVAWFTQSSGWVQLIAFLFPVLAVLWIANWTRQWRENDTVRKGKRPPS